MPNMTISADDPSSASMSEMIARLKAKKSESDGMVDYSKEAANVVSKPCQGPCGTAILALVLIIFSIAVPVAEIVVGSLYLHDCNAQYLLPIYLIVAGVFAALSGISKAADMIRNRSKDEDETNNKGGNGAGGLFSFFLFIWLICGSVWVFSMENCAEKFPAVAVANTTGCFTMDEAHSDSPVYCMELVYKFAYYVILIRWIFFAVSFVVGILICCCACCIFCCVSSSASKKNRPNEMSSLDSHQVKS